MCLLLNEKSELKIATKNIVVYKALNVLSENPKNINYGYGPYFNFRYDKYNIYTSYINVIQNELPYFTYDSASGYISQGLHSCLTRERAKWHLSLEGKIVKMIIPKGAYYIIGNNNEVVSDILIW